jgi:hypothetical protein
MLKYFIISCILLLGNMSWALPIVDNLHILEKTDSFLGSVPFSEAFKMGDEVVSDFHNADGTVKITSSMYKTDLEGAQLKLSYDNNVTLKYFSSAEYEKNNRNILRLKLKTFTSEGTKDYLEIISTEDLNYIFEDGAAVKAMNISILLKIFAPNLPDPLEIPFSFTIGTGLPAIGSLLEAHYFGSEITEKIRSVHRNKAI